jgi:hypothetical protein
VSGEYQRTTLRLDGNDAVLQSGYSAVADTNADSKPKSDRHAHAHPYGLADSGR